MVESLPIEFANRMKTRLMQEYTSYIEALESPAPVSIRIHPQKITQPLALEKVAWCNQGYYLPQRPIFTFDPVFQAGGYYVQEASSMFIGWAVQQLKLQSPIIALDLCAAPGGKSTHLLSILNPTDVLVTNEIIKTRVGVLKENIEKWGYPNCIITNNDPQDFENLEGFFDLIIVDAPCSGEGLFRKDSDTIKEWSEAAVELCKNRQQRILTSAIKALKPGGHLIYSTCTHSESENEENVMWMCDVHGLEELQLQPPQNSGIEESTFGYRFYPHKTKGEGFYCAALKKPSGNDTQYRQKKQWFSPAIKISESLAQYFVPDSDMAIYETPTGLAFFPYQHFETLNIIADRLKVVKAGTWAGTVIKDELIPEQGLAHSIVLNQNKWENIQLSFNEAIKYLRKDNISTQLGSNGWKLVKYQEFPLGFLKNLGPRSNNYFPKERRIIKQPLATELFSIISQE